MKLVMDYQQRPIYDVIAKLRGTDDDEWVVLGNHHDAWVFGAADPGSGTASMLETARALGELGAVRLEAAPHDRDVRMGWRGAGPDRLDRMGRSKSRRAAGEGRRLHQYGRRRHRAEFRASAHAVAEGIGARRHARSRTIRLPARSVYDAWREHVRARDRGNLRHRAASRADGHFRRSARRRAGRGLGLFCRSSITPEFRRSTWVSAATTASTTRSTTISTG